MREVEPVNVQVQFGNTETKALVDCGSVGTIIHKILANAMALSNKKNHWKKPSGLQDLKTFSNDLTKIVDFINNTVKS